MGTSYQAGIATKQLILDVSRKLFAEKGYNNTTYTDISNAAGMNRGLIPYHFKNKQSLGNAVCRNIFDEAYNSVVEMLDTNALSDDLVAALNIVVYYKLLGNSSFTGFMLSVMNDNNNEIFDINDESDNIRMLSRNFEKLDKETTDLLAHVSSALKKEAIVYYSHSENVCAPETYAALHINTLMKQAGCKSKNISELTEPALTLSSLLNYRVLDDMSVEISYK